MKTKRIENHDGRALELPEAIHHLAVWVANKYSLPLNTVLFGRKVGTRPSKSIAYARHELWTRTMNKLKWSYPETARMFGVNHTSIMDGRKEYEARTART